MMAYRATPHASRNCSPNLLTYGEELRLPVDLMYADTALMAEQPTCPQELVQWIQEASRRAFKVARHHLKTSAQRNKRNYDKNTYHRSFEVGQWVYVLYPPESHRKLGRQWQGPMLVIHKLSPVNYIVQASPTSRKITLHVDHIKLYDHPDTPNSWVESTDPIDVSVQTD